MQQTVPLPERNPSTPAEQQGLFRKFDVRRTDGSSARGGKHEGCEYFVLDVDHDPHAKAALAAYASAVGATHPQLAEDMRQRYGLPAHQPTADVELQPGAVPPAQAGLADAQIDRLLSTAIPGGSTARDWFLPHDTDRGLENVRAVVRAMLSAALHEPGRTAPAAAAASQQPGDARGERQEFEAWMQRRGTPLELEHPQAFDAWRAAKSAASALQAEPLVVALRRAKRLFDEALPHFNWGASALDANAMALLNEVPGEVGAALSAAERS